MAHQIITKSLGFMTSDDLYENLYISCEDLYDENNKAKYMVDNEDYKAIVYVKYTGNCIHIYVDGEYLDEVPLLSPSYEYNNPDYNEDDEDNIIDSLILINNIINKNEITICLTLN